MLEDGIIAAVIAESEIVNRNQRHRKKTPNRKNAQSTQMANKTTRQQLSWERAEQRGSLNAHPFISNRIDLNKIILSYRAARCQAQGSAFLPGF